MKKIICYLADDGVMVYQDPNLAYLIGSTVSTAEGFEEYVEPEAEAAPQSGVAQLVSLGITVDELLKLKATGLIQ